MAPGDRFPGGFWSLWDIMINFQVFGLAHLMQMLVLEERSVADRRRNLEMLQTLPVPMSQLRVEEAEAQRLSGLIQFAMHTCQQLEIGAGVDRAERFLNNLRRSILFIDLEPEIRILRETIEDGLRYICFYHYPDAKRIVLLRVETDWQPTIAQFPSAKADVIAATDCYALAQYTAAVFHAMRVLEYGLREMATAVNLTFDTQVWQDIIQQIESRIREIGDAWKKGTSKSDWMSFYSGAAKEFFHFKDGWRNHVSHNRAAYDEPSARNVLEHVRTFMNHLSTRLSETP
jgi:plasmid stabilization system protein ParE